MNATDTGAPLLDTDQAAFLSGPVAMNVASHDHALMPSVARGYGCRVSADRRQVTVFLSVPRSEVLLRDLRGGAPIAVVFTRPQTHQTLQLKGTCAQLNPLAPGDREIMRAYGAAFGAEIRAIGFADHFSRAMVTAVDDEALGIELTPALMFEQTPGPDAGRRLGPKS